MRVKIAATFRELLTKVDDRPYKYLSKTSIRGIVSRKIFRRFKFLVKSGMPWSSPNGHFVSVLFPDINLNDAYMGLVKKSPMGQKVILRCTCPAFQYYGAAFNSTNEKYNLDIRETRPPDIRDPNRTYKMCKHVLAVVKRLEKTSFKKLVEQFASAYLVKHERNDLKKLNIDKTSMLDPLLFEPDYLEFMGWEETLPIVENLLSSRADCREIISSITEDNYDRVLSECGLIV